MGGDPFHHYGRLPEPAVALSRQDGDMVTAQLPIQPRAFIPPPLSGAGGVADDLTRVVRIIGFNG